MPGSASSGTRSANAAAVAAAALQGDGAFAPAIAAARSTVGTAAGNKAGSGLTAATMTGSSAQKQQQHQQQPDMAALLLTNASSFDGALQQQQLMHVANISTASIGSTEGRLQSWVAPATYQAAPAAAAAVISAAPSSGAATAATGAGAATAAYSMAPSPLPLDGVATAGGAGAELESYSHLLPMRDSQVGCDSGHARRSRRVGALVPPADTRHFTRAAEPNPATSLLSYTTCAASVSCVSFTMSHNCIHHHMFSLGLHYHA